MASELKIGSVFNFIGIVVRLVVGFTMTPYMLACLGENNFGLFSLAGGILAYLALMDFGLGPAVTKYVAESVAKCESKAESRLIGQSIYLFSLLGLLFLAASAVVYFFLGDIYGKELTDSELANLQEMYLLLVVSTAIFFPTRAFAGVVSAHQKFKLPGFVGFINSCLNVGVTFLLLWLGYGPVALVLAGVLLNTGYSLWNCYYCLGLLQEPIIFGKPDLTIFKSMIRFSLGIFINQLYDLINWQLGPVLLGAIAGTSAVAVFRVGSQIPSIFVSLPWAISSVLFARVVGMVTLGISPRELTMQMVRVARMQSFIIYIALLGFILFGKEFMQLWVGDELGDQVGVAWQISIIMMAAMTIPLLQCMGIMVIQAYELNYYKAGILCSTMPVTCLLAYYLSARYQSLGFAWATAISGIGLTVLLNNILIYKSKLHLEIGLFFRETLRGSYVPLALTVLGGVALQYAWRDSPESWLSFCIKAGALALVYVVSMWFCWANPEERRLMLSFRERRTS